jgi:hypothetical protein
MDAATGRQLERLNRKLNALTTWIGEQDPALLTRSPPPGAWSVAQVIEHMRTTELLSFSYIRKKAQSEKPLPKQGLQSWSRERLLSFYLASPFKWKAPAIVNTEAFPAKLDPAKQLAEWAQTRKALGDWLAEQPQDYFKRLGYRHPIVGRLTVAGMVRFFEWHFDRHHKQILRTYKAVSE